MNLELEICNGNEIHLVREALVTSLIVTLRECDCCRKVHRMWVMIYLKWQRACVGKQPWGYISWLANPNWKPKETSKIDEVFLWGHKSLVINAIVKFLIFFYCEKILYVESWSFFFGQIITLHGRGGKKRHHATGPRAFFRKKGPQVAIFLQKNCVKIHNI